jgi:metal-sulfur cluster biosynthetic enzyme
MIPGPSKARVNAALGTVIDPELGMSITELGLVYDIEIDEGTVGITMTLTAPGCPLHGLLADGARAAVMAVPGVEHVEVVMTFDPPWTPDRIHASSGGDGGGQA